MPSRPRLRTTYSNHSEQIFDALAGLNEHRSIKKTGSVAIVSLNTRLDIRSTCSARSGVVRAKSTDQSNHHLSKSTKNKPRQKGASRKGYQTPKACQPCQRQQFRDFSPRGRLLPGPPVGGGIYLPQPCVLEQCRHCRSHQSAALPRADWSKGLPRKMGH